MKRKKLEERNGITGKECLACNDWKPLEEYGNHKQGLGGKTSRCQVCENIRKTKWRKENPDKHKQSVKNWHEENKESFREYQKEWTQGEKRQKYLVEYRENTKEHRANWGKKYKQENKEQVALDDQRRRAREKSLPSTWTKEEQEQCLTFFGGCALTGSQDIHFDHVIALSTGHGGTTKENMIPLRSDLNMSKNDSNLFEWFKKNKERYEITQSKFDRLVQYLAEINGLTSEEYEKYVYDCYTNQYITMGQ